MILSYNFREKNYFPIQRRGKNLLFLYNYIYEIPQSNILLITNNNLINFYSKTRSNILYTIYTKPIL